MTKEEYEASQEAQKQAVKDLIESHIKTIKLMRPVDPLVQDVMAPNPLSLTHFHIEEISYLDPTGLIDALIAMMEEL